MGSVDPGARSMVNVVLVSSSMVMAPPEEVKGPTVPAGLGNWRERPSAGTGSGMATLKLMVPPDMVAGVAPVTSSCVVADPFRVLPSAAAAEARAAGKLASV